MRSCCGIATAVHCFAFTTARKPMQRQTPDDHLESDEHDCQAADHARNIKRLQVFVKRLRHEKLVIATGHAIISH